MRTISGPMRAIMGGACVVLLAAACATTRSPVPVMGEVASLAGSWVGEYEGLESGRSGSIVFELRAGRDTAFGDVLMTPRGVAGGHIAAMPAGDRPAAQLEELQRSQVLSIAFTRVQDGRVSGTLDPYPSPDCGCRLVTTFTGALESDRITGIYISRHEDGTFEQGRWSVKRRKSE